ncbi:MAG: hypothetical protein ACT4PQ_02540 [Betaproteobacteria bacterium]
MEQRFLRRARFCCERFRTSGQVTPLRAPQQQRESLKNGNVFDLRIPLAAFERHTFPDVGKHFASQWGA